MEFNGDIDFEILHLHCTGNKVGLFTIDSYFFFFYSLSDKSRPDEREPLLGVMWPKEHRHNHDRRSILTAAVPNDKGGPRPVSGLAEGWGLVAGGGANPHHEHDGRQSQRAAALSRRGRGEHRLRPQRE